MHTLAIEFKLILLPFWPSNAVERDAAKALPLTLMRWNCALHFYPDREPSSNGIDTVYFKNRYLKKDGFMGVVRLDLPSGNTGKRAVIRSCPRHLRAKDNSRAFGPTRHLRQPDGPS